MTSEGVELSESALIYASEALRNMAEYIHWLHENQANLTRAELQGLARLERFHPIASLINSGVVSVGFQFQTTYLLICDAQIYLKCIL